MMIGRWKPYFCTMSVQIASCTTSVLSRGTLSATHRSAERSGGSAVTDVICRSDGVQLATVAPAATVATTTTTTATTRPGRPDRQPPNGRRRPASRQLPASRSTPPTTSSALHGSSVSTCMNGR